MNIELLREYDNLLKEQPMSKNSKRKAIDKRINEIKNEHINIDTYVLEYSMLLIKENYLLKTYTEIDGFRRFLNDNKNKVIAILIELGYLVNDLDLDLDHMNKTNNTNKITKLGENAIQIKEMNGLIASHIINNEKINSLSAIDLICLFSCFVDIPTSEENRDQHPSFLLDKNVIYLLQDSENITNRILDMENKYSLCHDGSISKLNYDLADYCKEWCNATDIEECNKIIKSLNDEKQIFLGDFCKIIIKINNIGKEWYQVAEKEGRISLMSELNKMPDLLLKYVISNQSLYV
jgi:hypothetical protein